MVLLPRVLPHGSDVFVNDGVKIRGWDETGLHVGSACHFGGSIGTLVTADADVARQPAEVLVYLVYWGLTPEQQPGSYQGGEMMMKSVSWWRKPEYPEETTDLRQVTDETFHTYGLCPVRGLNLGRSGVKQSELRRDESGASSRLSRGECRSLML